MFDQTPSLLHWKASNHAAILFVNKYPPAYIARYSFIQLNRMNRCDGESKHLPPVIHHRTGFEPGFCSVARPSYSLHVLTGDETVVEFEEHFLSGFLRRTWFSQRSRGWGTRRKWCLFGNASCSCALHFLCGLDIISSNGSQPVAGYSRIGWTRALCAVSPAF